jgi:hypothetical protein
MKLRKRRGPAPSLVQIKRTRELATSLGIDAIFCTNSENGAIQRHLLYKSRTWREPPTPPSVQVKKNGGDQRHLQCKLRKTAGLAPSLVQIKNTTVANAIFSAN